MFERMFVLVSGLCDIKELSVLVSHQVWFMHVSLAPFRKEKGGGEEEGKKYPRKQSNPQGHTGSTV